jgi:O-antigen/teichoic acid export membrane protein
MSADPASANPADAAALPSPRSAPVAHNRRRVAANFLGMTLTTGVGMIAGILISVYVRRTLGPEAFGQLSWSLAVLGYLGMISSPGLQIIGQLEIAREPGSAVPVASAILSVQLALSVVAYLAVAALAGLELRGPAVSAVLMLQGLTLFTAALDPGFIMQGRERMVAPGVATLLFSLAQAPFLVWLVHGPGDLFVYIGLGLVFTLANLVYRLWFVGRFDLIDVRRLRPTFHGAGRLLSAAWPLALTQGAIMIFYNCDSVILGFTHGDEAVGQYAGAYKLMLVSTAISGALCTAYFPSLGRAHRDPEQATRIAREFASVLAWMGLPLAALGWAFGRYVVTLLYGPAFYDSSIYFQWLCINVALIYVNVALGTPLTAWGMQKLHLKITGSAALLNIGANIILIPIYGPPAAIATTIGTEIVITVAVIAVRRHVRLGWSPISRVILPPLAVSTAVAVAAACLPSRFDSYWVLELAGASAMLLGAFLVAERRVVRGVLRQALSRVARPA